PRIGTLEHAAVGLVALPGLVGIDVDNGLAAVRQGLGDRVAIGDRERIGLGRGDGQDDGRQGGQCNALHGNPLEIGRGHLGPRTRYGERVRAAKASKEKNYWMPATSETV